ncbi:Uncharacterised protein [Yersinia enterocolitica]|nr:Uncharacterised protein [Yersinia enterocolitica]
MLPPVKLVRGCLNNGIFKETLPDYPLQNVRFTLLADAHIPPLTTELSEQSRYSFCTISLMCPLIHF